MLWSNVEAEMSLDHFSLRPSRLDRKRVRRRYAGPMSFWLAVKTVPGHVR